MSGKWISIGRRPCGPAFAMSVASWAMAMARTMDSPRPWWSQNVILELGFFIGALGRRYVCALKAEEVEEPSDIRASSMFRSTPPGVGSFAWLVKSRRQVSISI